MCVSAPRAHRTCHATFSSFQATRGCAPWEKTSQGRGCKEPHGARTLLMRCPIPLETGLPGDHSEREPPDPIPNSEVKPLSADDSAAPLWCESRSSPGPYSPHHPPSGYPGGGSCLWEEVNLISPVFPPRPPFSIQPAHAVLVAAPGKARRPSWRWRPVGRMPAIACLPLLFARILSQNGVNRLDRTWMHRARAVERVRQ